MISLKDRLLKIGIEPKTAEQVQKNKNLTAALEDVLSYVENIEEVSKNQGDYSIFKNEFSLNQI